jgi:tRNA(Ile)-lysidine synthase
MTATALDALETKLANLPDGALCVAFSGGMDSSALLHRLAASPLARLRGLRALHIDHALQPDSARWADHCTVFANALNVPIQTIAVTVDRHAGAGPEDAARRARFAAFARHLRDGEILALAHHRDDQVETVLLKLLRGAGPEGLGGMREFRTLGSGFLWRPLLDVPRSALSDYARDNKLAWIDDPSNADTSLRRNFLRNEILPRLTQRWSDASSAISHSAAWMRAASDFIGDEAQRALATMRGEDADSLHWQAWLDLPAALRDAVLRLWLRTLNLPSPAFFHVEELEKQLRHAAQDRTPCIRWPGCEIRRYRGCIYAMTPLVDAGDWELEWLGGELALPSGDTLAVIADGKPLTWSHRLTVRNRRGGERLKPAGRAHHRDVRLLLQESAIAPWRRSRIPLIFAGDELIAVGDLFANDTAREWLDENRARIVCGAPVNLRDRH